LPHAPAVERLVELLVESRADASHQMCLLLIGNLASSEVASVEAAEARRRLLAVSGFRKVLPHLHSSIYPTQLYALGAVRNLCSEADYVLALQEENAVERLKARAEIVLPFTSLHTTSAPFFAFIQRACGHVCARGVHAVVHEQRRR
jgi:hypothetical protein